MHTFLFIVLQICLALQIAQNTFGFVHYDTTPWNVIILKYEKKISVDYVLDYDTIYRINTDTIPVLIDMEKSHIIYNNLHYGIIDQFKMNSVQDILSLLSTSLYELTNNKNISKEVITLANFISGTEYRREKFGKISEVRYFFGKTKKFTELVFSEKYDLVEKRPLDLILYILENFPQYNFPIETVNKARMYDYVNSVQHYNFLLSETEEGKIKSFTDIFKNVKKRDNINIFVYKSVKGKFEKILSDCNSYINSLDISNKEEVLEEVKKRYEKALTILDKKYINEVGYTNIDSTNNVNRIEYDENIFLFPDKILSILENNKGMKKINFLKRKSTLLDFLSLYPEERKVDINEAKIDTSSLYTLCSYSEIIYTSNVLSIKGGNQAIKEYISKNEKILAFLHVINE